MHDPRKGRWQTVKWILRYIHSTTDIGLKFERDDRLGQNLVGYVDSDYAGDLDKRHSTTGYVFTLAKGPVSWRSTLQSTVALSTTEVEYMAVTEAFKEAIWLHGLIEDLGIVQEHVDVYVIVKVLFVLQRIRFIIPTPSTSMFDFILLKKLWMKGIFCYRRLVLQIIQLTCSQNVSQISSSNIVWT